MLYRLHINMKRIRRLRSNSKRRRRRKEAKTTKKKEEEKKKNKEKKVFIGNYVTIEFFSVKK